MPPTYCVPSLGALPDSALTFDWFTAGPVDTLQYSPDNPLWIGAFSLSEGNGANRDYVFRTNRGNIGGQQYLFLSFLIRDSDLDINGADRINFLLGNSPNYVAIQAKLASASSTIAGTENAGIFSYRVQSCTANGMGQIIATPGASTNEADMEATGRMWVDVTAPGRNLHTAWAFQLAIKLGANWSSKNLNLPASGTFKFWYELRVSTAPATSTLYQMTGVPANVHTTSSLQLVPQLNDPNDVTVTPLLESQLLELSTSGAGCTAGVALSYSNIGTRNPDNTPRANTSTIKLDLGQAYPPNMAVGAGPLYPEAHVPVVNQPQFQNMFFAAPTFPGGTNTAALRARFSLANWGSQIMVGASWTPIPGLGDVAFSGADIHQVWPSGVADAFTTNLVQNINKYLNSTAKGTPMPASAQNPHQCIYVELSSTDPNVIITSSSAYHNMDIASASTFRRYAEISVKGLKVVNAAKPRDVYLRLQTFNMPKVVDNDDRGGGDFTHGGNKSPFASASSTGQGRPPEVEDVIAFQPTYAVHCYHDTGEQYALENGTKVKVLRPQTAFGYFAVHDGPLHGWESRIYGAEKITDNVYILRVPNNGVKLIETVLQARESAQDTPLPETGPEPPQPGEGGGGGDNKGCLGGLFGIFKKKP